MKTFGVLARLLLVLVCCGTAFHTGSFALGEEIRLAPPKGLGRAAPERGKAEVQWGGSWYPAEVLKEEDGKFHIKYDGYGDVWNEWVGKDRIRFPGKPPAEVQQAEVEWNGTWFPAKVLETKEGKFHIKYDGYGDEWNERVGMDRIRFPDKKKAEVVQVDVEWHGTWYPAKVLEQKDGKFYIKYDGYSDASNEWVGKERIRFPDKAAAAPDKVEVEWAGTWYPAKVLEKKDGKSLIKYDGYGDSFNEWVGPDRIRAVKDVDRKIKPKFALPDEK